MLFPSPPSRGSTAGSRPKIMSLITREAIWSEDKDALRQIRKVVFIQEQNVPKELEWDDRDTECWHALVELNGEVVATGRVDTDGKIGRMAVLNEARGQNFGKAVLSQLIKIARREGIAKTYMHAQCHALPFYLKNGFKAIGDVYDEAGIPHQNAEEILEVESLAFSDAVELLAKESCLASHSIYIKLIDLNHPLLTSEEFVQVLKELCLQNTKFKIEILLEKTRPNKRSAEFVRNYQRLTDKISIKRYVASQAKPDRRQYIVVDNKLVAWQPNPDYTDLRILRAADRINYFTDAFRDAFSISERDLSMLKLYI